MQNGAYGTVEVPAAPKKKSIRGLVASVGSLRGNHRVVLHAIDATPAQGVAMPVPRRSTEPGRQRHRREMT